MVAVPSLLSKTFARSPMMTTSYRCVHKFVCFAQRAGGTRDMSSSSRPPQVAVIGAGVAGAVCSHLLAKRGVQVEVFDMGKQMPGGRVSSRTAGGTGDKAAGSAGGGGGGGGGSKLPFQFDYGCQFFQAKSPAMKRLVAEWVAAGVVAEWRPRLGVYDMVRGVLRPHDELSPSELTQLEASGLPPLPSPSAGPLYVGHPSMAALVDHLLRPEAGQEDQQQKEHDRQQQREAQGGGGGGGVTLRLGTRVHSARRLDGRWLLTWQVAQRGGEGGSRDAAGTRHQQQSGWYDALVLTDSQVARPGAPGHVAFEDASPALQELAASLRSQTRMPQFALMLGWGPSAEVPESSSSPAAAASPSTPVSPVSSAVAAAPRLPVDAFHVLGGSAVQWIANDTTKPGRSRPDEGQCWVAITRPDFAARILTDSNGGGGGGGGGGASDGAAAGPSPPPPSGPEYRARKAAEIWAALQTDLAGVPGLGPLTLNPPSYMTAHRWSSCYTATPLGVPAAAEAAGGWAACGDFCTGPGLERAAASGAAAAEAVADMLRLPPAAGAGADAAEAELVLSSSPYSDWEGAF